MIRMWKEMLKWEIHVLGAHVLVFQSIVATSLQTLHEH